MRRNLGLDGSSRSSSANDPLKAARQAIRSQVTAREFTERQLVQAQNAIQNLRTKLRHVHQEREAAINAAQSAMVAKDAAERSMRTAESALATERAARARVEGMLRDAEGTIRDLREKLATAQQTLHGVQAELVAERSSGVVAGDGVIAAQEVVAPTAREAVPTVRRPVGRPRKAAVVETVPTMITPSEKPLATRGGAVPPNVDAAVPINRRPVGRPRKTMVVLEPVKTAITQPKNPRASAKAVTAGPARRKERDQRRRADNEEPVKWWVEGWKEL